MRRARATYDTSLGVFRRVTIEEEGRAAERLAVKLPGLDLPYFDYPVDLWSEKATAKFKAAFGKTSIASGLDRTLFNLPEPFRLAIPNDRAASIPWEAFQRDLHESNRHKLAPLRLIDTEPAFAYAAVPEKMRLMLLVGDPGGGPSFDPQMAEDFLRAAVPHPGAEEETCLAADPVHSVQLREDSLQRASGLAAQHKPNVVVYFGHGRHLGKPQLCLGSGESGWKLLTEVATTLFPVAEARPPFWIFWACSLAEDTTQPTMRIDGPDVLNALGPYGAVSVLAMRSKVRVSSARVMLDALLQAFTSGEPLDVAAAAARAAVLAVEVEATEHMDFAAPAVWSISEPVDRLTWGTAEAFPASWVSLPLLGANGNAPDLASGVAPVDHNDQVLAGIWAQPGRLFATVPTDSAMVVDPAVQARFFAIGAAIRRTTGRPVVPILLRQGPSFDQRLRFWAQEAHARLDPRHHDRAIASAIESIKADCSYGLQRLLAIPRVVIMVSEPPERSAVWEALRQLRPDATLIVVGSTPPAEALEWRLDQLLRDAVIDAPFLTAAGLLQEVLGTVPEAMAMLAVVERPMRLADVALEAGVALDLVSRAEPLLVRVGGRRVLGEVARREVLGHLQGPVIARAHRRCIAFLSQQPIDHNFSAIVEVARHYLSLGEGAEAATVVNAGFEAAGATWTQSELYQLFRMAAESRHLRDHLSDGLLIAIGDAGVDAQDTSVALGLLNALYPRKAADRARVHSLLSEAYKADVTTGRASEEMRAHAQRAVAISLEASIAIKDDLARKLATIPFQINMARIKQYFDHAYADAHAEYQSILAQLEPEALSNEHVGQAYAAAARNAAECLLDPAPRPLMLDVRDAAEELLRRGGEVARRHGLYMLQAEILYTGARVAQAAGDNAGAIALLTQIREDPAASRFSLVDAIARDRCAWLEISMGRRAFSLEDLWPRLRALDLLSFHAWALRVAIESRVRAAKALARRGRTPDLDCARRLLLEALDATRDHPGLTGESDGRRAAQVYAGLQLLGGDGARYWNDFLSSPQFQFNKARAGMEGRYPQDIWGEET